MPATESTKATWKSFRATALAAFVVLLVLIGGAYIIRRYVLTSWEDYTSVAALILGVGGVFAFVALGSDAARESSNVVGLGAVGFGGIMLALKEVTYWFSAPEQNSAGMNQESIGLWLFLGSSLLIFLVLLVLVGLGVALSVRAEGGANPSYRWGFVGIGLGAVVLVVGISSSMWVFIIMGWVILLAGGAGILFLSRIALSPPPRTEAGTSELQEEPPPGEENVH